MNQADWQNPGWVLAVMHYPREPDLLSVMRDSTLKFVAPRDYMRANMSEATRTGIVAGNVLATLYTLAESPWRIALPSLGKAIHATARFAFDVKYADGSPMPRGDTEVRNCFDAMRPVAHLWAALRLHREYPIHTNTDLTRTDEGVRTLLRIARTVQSWALEWRPRRTASHVPLLSESPWIVPDLVDPLYPPWTHEPDWLLKTIAAYTRRRR